MSRPMETDTRTALSARAVSYALLAEFEISDVETVNVWTGVGEISWNSKIWAGLGQFGGISQVTEAADGTLDKITYELSGVDNAIVSTLLSEILDNPIEGRLAKCWIALFNTDMSLIGAPVLLRQDVMAEVSTRDSTGSAMAQVTASPPGIALGRASFRVYSDADQQAEFSGDDFFANIETVGVRKVSLG